jgi:AcrR family transcriptional regulator
MQLLDCAGRIVLDYGLSKFTIDALAKEAQVSMPLIYKYFNARLEILQALLVRESNQFTAILKDRLERATDYEEVVRMFVAINFEGARTGSLLSVLFSQPDVKRGLDPTEFDWINQILVERTALEFDLAESLARQIVPMGSAASRTAAERFRRHGGNREQAINNTVKFIFGAFRAMSSDT